MASQENIDLALHCSLSKQDISGFSLVWIECFVVHEHFTNSSFRKKRVAKIQKILQPITQFKLIHKPLDNLLV